MARPHRSKRNSPDATFKLARSTLWGQAARCRRALPTKTFGQWQTTSCCIRKLQSDAMPELCVLDVPDGACLEDMLFERGVEFPCGGYSQCGGCRVHVIEGNVPVTSDMREVLSPEELADGWRLACQASVTGRVVLRIGQWDAPILSDDDAVHFEAREGFGIAVDLGTTTLVAQLLDLRSGRIVDVRTALNPQSAHGADLMSRVQFDMAQPGVLTRSIREALRVMVRDLTGNLDLRDR